MKKILDTYIHQQPDGTFRVDVRDGEGKRIRLTFLRRDEARACVRKALFDREDSKQTQRGVKRGRRLIIDAIGEYREEKMILLRPASITRYRSILEWLELFVRKHNIVYIDQFDPDKHGIEIRRELMAPRKDLRRSTDRMFSASPKTINLYLQTIRGLFQREVRNRNLNFNPMANVQNLPLQPKPPEYFSENEITAFFSQPMPVAYRRVFLGLLTTGLRFAELANLRWVDVDFDKRLVTVTAHDDFKPKTQNALRSIPMSETLYSLLREINMLPLSSKHPFTSTTGQPLRERHTLFICKSVGTSAGIKRAFLHKFRHTFATQLLARGATLEQLKALLGHSSIKETEMYAHPEAAHLHDVVSLLDGLPGLDKMDTAQEGMSNFCPKQVRVEPPR